MGPGVKGKKTPVSPHLMNRTLADRDGYAMILVPAHRDLGEPLDGGEDEVAQEGGARSVRLLMSPPPQVLVATICRDKLNDGTSIVRAVLEDDPLNDLGPVTQDQ